MSDVNGNSIDIDKVNDNISVNTIFVIDIVNCVIENNGREKGDELIFYCLTN